MKNNDSIYGYAGKILRVNLSSGNISTEPTAKYAKDWIGSSGIAIKILYDELHDWVTPFDPANKLIIGAGALVGTTAIGANKLNISTLGPMTGGWASSFSDSYLGGQLKRAGYDSIVIEGKAHSPVYLWINDDIVEIRDASHLWGKTTEETYEAIREIHGDKHLHTFSIGPAGENLVRSACVIQDKTRACGRGGSGAVMGSKNLKTIVANGSGSVKVADGERFMARVSKSRNMYKGLPTTESFHKFGTLGLMEGKQDVCGIPYKNFQDTHLPDEMAAVVDPKNNIEKYEISKKSYPGCAFGGCSRMMHVTEGPYAGLITESNQWEVVGTLQGRLAMQEPTFMLKANNLCNQLGLDVDGAGGAIGWAMECYQRGIIDEKDTDGLKLEWGDAEVALELIHKISYREGFGNLLAEGCAKAADILGRDSKQYAIHIKGLDLYESLRGSMGWSLGATTSTRGGGHTTGAPVIETQGALDVEKAREVYGIDNPHKASEYKNKAKMVHFSESLQRINNCFGVCHWNTAYLDPNLPSLPQMAELYSAATGWERSVEDLKMLTMRQLNLEKAFNLRFTNFARKDDMPTSRDLNEPIKTGKMAGWRLDVDKFNEMLDEYYDLHGWDRETSFPKRETLVQLGLEYVADDLERIGKLPDESASKFPSAD